MVVQDQAEMGEGLANPTDPRHIPTFIQPSTSQPQKKQKPKKPKRKDTQIPQSSGPTKHVANKAIYKDSLGTTFGGYPKFQETIGDTIAQTRFENVSKHSNNPLLVRGNTLLSGEDSLKLNELMELCTNLQTRVLDLDNTKTTQAGEIVSLKRRVKKLEQKKRSRTYGLKRLYKVSLTTRVESSGDKESLGEDASKQGRINAIDADEDITLVNDIDDVDMFDVNTLTGDEVSAATTTTTAIIPTPRKGIVITELELEKSLKKKDQLKLDEEIVLNLQAEIDEEERLAREKDEANIALTEE
ncbi:hypothetical protein Tco_0404112 [Tanacetum coccineum]